MSNARLKLLIVDNDPSVRYFRSEMFRCMGHAVRTAEDAVNALQEMAESVPDIVLADLGMPGMSGFELLSAVHRLFPSVYVIAMSGATLRGGMGHEIATQGYCDKVSGVVALLQALSNNITSDRLSVWAYRKSTPVIMKRGESSRFTTSEIFISCRECQKAFSQPFDVGRSHEETKCIHCRVPVSYTAVEQISSIQ